MANIKIATITNHVRIDQSVIDAALLAGDVLQIEVNNAYIDAAPQLVNYEDIPAPYKACVKDTIDYASYLDEDPALVYQVDLENGTHTMTGYARTGVKSDGVDVTVNDPIIAVFMIGWLNGTTGRLELPLTLKIGEALDSTEVSDLVDRGITVSGTGDSFTISTTTPYLLQCVQPPLETRTHVITHGYDINLIRN